MAEPAVRAVVCGHPVAHSRSPLIHGYWLDQLGIDGSYDRIDVAPQDFPAFVREFAARGLTGANVTLPHKEMAFSLVGRRDEAAVRIGAVNTLWLEEGIVCGGNTDAYGFVTNLDENAAEWRDSRVAVVLGAGGASRAVIHALDEAGVREIRVVNRSKGRAEAAADRFGPAVSAHEWPALAELLADADLLVNTTSLGMEGKGKAVIDLHILPDHAIVSDIVYVPVRTALLRDAGRRGLTTVDGLGMLLHQAVPGFERWFGRRPEVTPELTALLTAELERGA